MKTRSATLYHAPAHGAAALPVVGLRRGVWQPALRPSQPSQPSRQSALSGHPLLQSLRGLVAWLQRARALNSQVL